MYRRCVSFYRFAYYLFKNSYKLQFLYAGVTPKPKIVVTLQTIV